MIIPKIKICGITNSTDASLAIQAGADYLGLIFASASPRCVSIEQAQDILNTCTDVKSVEWVGVFQNQPAEFILSAIQMLQLNLVQLHGEESLAECEKMPVPVIKVFQTHAAPNLTIWQSYFSVAKYIMIDKPKTKENSPDYYVETLNWIAAHQKELPPVFVAGGLNSHNVGDIIAKTHPYAVDVTSGIEQLPGTKDATKLKAFCDTVKQHRERS